MKAFLSLFHIKKCQCQAAMSLSGLFKNHHIHISAFPKHRCYVHVQFNHVDCFIFHGPVKEDIPSTLHNFLLFFSFNVPLCTQYHQKSQYYHFYSIWFASWSMLCESQTFITDCVGLQRPWRIYFHCISCTNVHTLLMFSWPTIADKLTKVTTYKRHWSTLFSSHSFLDEDHGRAHGAAEPQQAL